MLESKDYTIKCNNEIANSIITIEFIKNSKAINKEIKVKELLKYIVWECIDGKDFLPPPTKSK